MANDDHIAQLMKGVDAWNAWRKENRNIWADLSEADLSEAPLNSVDLRGAQLYGVNLSRARLNLANLSGANLIGADLRGARLVKADLWRARLDLANLSGADLRLANLEGAVLREANLSGADLSGASLHDANLIGANLRGADLQVAILIRTDISGADLTGCRVYGISAWDVKLEKAQQQNLVINRSVSDLWFDVKAGHLRPSADEPAITVDNIEVAQFIYLMLHNQKVRDVIDTVTSKAVLILGRFTDERKAVLDALREELRKRDYLPILFDFAVPATRDITETVSLLARMARFIIADLTDPSSIPKELEAIVPSLAVPVQPLLEGSSRPYAMFKDYWKYEWVLPVYRYEGLEPLLATLAEKVIAPAEGKVKALAERRRLIEAELTKPQ
jgi:hypothetical protein